ncbi:hypothetical protein SD71_11310 [Cohnella kolymensis]|uniref:Inhibitor of sigma-G Gin n=1 Tax=Cohnella kolymensis TaxID=1590652 RepID=A0ABR5A4I8_9BACL|nr:hypothetical protein [Cohnella kolymensis]KIL35944.1 hypothetical protein SD71_11310 [Cohnella kolymensis]
MINNTGNTTGTTAEKACCFACGETMDNEQPSGSSILCSSCGDTADLPMSAYFLNQYYYRFAD